MNLVIASMTPSTTPFGDRFNRSVVHPGGIDRDPIRESARGPTAAMDAACGIMLFATSSSGRASF
jgi:hypothetical protein